MTLATHSGPVVLVGSSMGGYASLVASIGHPVRVRDLFARVEPVRREEVIRKADIATGGKITAAAIKGAAEEA